MYTSTRAHIQFLNSIVGICATTVHTYIRWVDFPMAMSAGQSVVIYKRFKRPSLPC